MNWEIVVTIAVELAGGIFLFGALKNKTENHDAQITEIKTDYEHRLDDMRAEFNRSLDELKSRQDKTEGMFSAIQNQLSNIQEQQAYIRGNVDLLISGKIKQ